MSMPTIPDMGKIEITTAEAVALVLASIGMEELGLAHLINAEAEKIQYAVGTISGKTTSTTIGELIELDKSVQSTMKDIIKKEMLLQFKLEEIARLI